MTREELINLAGQVANGILSSNSSWVSKAIEVEMPKRVANISVKIAKAMLEEIDNYSTESNKYV